MSIPQSSSNDPTTEASPVDPVHPLTGTKIWSTHTLTSSDDTTTTGKRRKNAMIILNTPLLEFELFDTIWRAGKLSRSIENREICIFC